MVPGNLIPVVRNHSAFEAIAHAAPGTEGGTGGMMTKIRAAK